MIRDDRKNDTVVGDTTVVNFSDERRVRGAAGPRLHTRKGSSLAHAVVESAGAKGGQLLEDMARALAADQGGEFVKAVRRSRGYSQEDLAKRIGVSQARISQWENMKGSRETIDLINLFMIAIACNFALKLSWDEKLAREAGSRRKGQPPREKQESPERHGHRSRHDREEM